MYRPVTKLGGRAKSAQLVSMPIQPACLVAFAVKIAVFPTEIVDISTADGYPCYRFLSQNRPW